MSETQFFVSTQPDPPLLLRRVTTDGGLVDEAFLDGAWTPTKIVVDYMFGNDDFVEAITAARARELEPAAFAVPV